jgi:Xaa-Pro aminopeptidase
MKNNVPRNIRAIRSMQAGLRRSGGGALLLTGEKDIRYASSFYSAGAVMLIPVKGHPLFFIDEMNRTLTDFELRGTRIEVVTLKAPMAETLVRYVKDLGIKKILLDGRKISHGHYLEISKSLSGISLLVYKGAGGAWSPIEDIRKIKSAEEVSILREAARETIRIWKAVRKNIRPGITENEIAIMADVMIRERGYVNAFPTIAAIGTNSAYPHAVPTDKKLEEGEHVLLDLGIRYEGYCSDLTRIWAEGRINRQIREFYRHVRQSQNLAISCIRPGVMVNTLVRKAEDILIEKGQGRYMLHGLGHGIGLDVHEGPFLRKGSPERLKKGMVLTIEPGLYLPGLGGMRLEDMVLVTAEGCEVLTL